MRSVVGTCPVNNPSMSLSGDAIFILFIGMLRRHCIWYSLICRRGFSTTVVVLSQGSVVRSQARFAPRCLPCAIRSVGCEPFSTADTAQVGAPIHSQSASHRQSLRVSRAGHTHTG